MEARDSSLARTMLVDNGSSSHHQDQDCALFGSRGLSDFV